MRAAIPAGLLVWLVLAEHGALGVLAGAGAGLAAWWVESNVWPEIPCWFPLCKSGRVSRSPFTPEAWRSCPVCHGRGRRRRVLAGGGR